MQQQEDVFNNNLEINARCNFRETLNKKLDIPHGDTDGLIKDKMNFTIKTDSFDDVQKSFTSIANELINEHELKINDKVFQFIDIEFYFFNNVHKDGFTMSHNRKLGEFEAHRYGIDISLGNSDNSYGGILIKSLLHETRIISKSQIKNEIINNFQIGHNKIEISKKQRSTEKKLIQTERENLGIINVTKNRTERFKKGKYRFIVYDKETIRKLKGKESFLRKSNLAGVEIQELIGYKLSI